MVLALINVTNVSSLVFRYVTMSRSSCLRFLVGRLEFELLKTCMFPLSRSDFKSFIIGFTVGRSYNDINSNSK